MRSDRDLYLKDADKKSSERPGGIAKLAALLILFAVCIGLLVYLNGGNSDWRSIVNLIKKRVMNTSAVSISSIQIDPDGKSVYLPYKSGIVCVNANGIKYYNLKGKEEWRDERSLGNPLVKATEKYLIVGDAVSKMLYLFNGKNLLWEKSIDGEIASISVNEKGFSGVIYKGSKTKLIVEVFDARGIKRMSRYYSSNYAVDLQISQDNKYAAIGEMDVNGLKVSTGVGVIPIGTELYSSFFEEGSVFANLNYIGKDLILVLDDKIVNVKLPDCSKTIIKELEKGQVTSLDTGSGKYIVLIEKTNKFLSMANSLKILNPGGKQIGAYEMPGRVVNVDSDREIIAVNSGDKIIFLNSSGAEISRFNPKKEVQEVKLCYDSSHAAVMYPDRVDIINVY
ncbi:MAG: DUF5711 family protein [Deltaproteobacteria bacterium]